MTTIKDIINKIKWDPNIKDKDSYSLFYLDRITKRLVEIRFNQIKNIEGSFLIVDYEDETKEIPMHRIKKIMKDKEVIFQR